MRKQMVKANISFRVACTVENDQVCFAPGDEAYLDLIVVKAYS